MVLIYDTNTWGSISDLVMVITTIVTVILLFITFKSQKQVQIAQMKLLEIEKVRFRESLKPNFEYTLVKDEGHLSDEKKRIVSIQVINISDREALEVSAPLMSENPRIPRVFRPEYSAASPKYLKKGSKPYLMHFVVEKDELSFIHFSLSYKDIEETKYQQKVLCMVDGDFSEIHYFPPEIITNTK